ncbi:sensor histidine kinase [Palleronia sp. KMU-117]|uniref:sensor histidine kinase n=1 Tax=Palleronia sp. KMU-117 TaxID=3434108 RepID=UPI003D765D5F
MRSLRSRTILGAVLWAVLSTVVGAIALTTILDAAANRRFDQTLADRHLQVIVALGTIGDPENGIELLLTDPAYGRVYSGRYWQITGPDERTFASRSLFDSVLEGAPAPGPTPRLWDGAGPDGALRGLRQAVTLDDGSTWTVDVAESLAALRADQAQLRRSVVVAFGLVGALGVAGALLLTTAILQPLGRLGRDLARRSDSGAALVPDNYPDEIGPLVTEINDLLLRNQSVVDRARRQSSDLAHALKTPSAALRNEIESLGAQGHAVDPALEAMGRIDAQISRSLARFRAESSRGTVRLSTDLGHARDRLMRLFRTMPDARALQFDLPPCGTAVFAAADAQDVEEILGNLLENAVKWASGTIRVSLSAEGAEARIEVEDDGPGIPAADRAKVIDSGFRLDTAKPGTGLGLAIVSDLVHAYGGRLVLDRSDRLGGLHVLAALPRSERLPAASTEGAPGRPAVGAA